MQVPAKAPASLVCDSSSQSCQETASNVVYRQSHEALIRRLKSSSHCIPGLDQPLILIFWVHYTDCHALQVLPDWSRRLAHTRSLPPPWQRPSVTPSLIRQQASAPLSQPAATSGSTGSQSLTQQHSHTTSLQQWEGQESKSPLVQQHVLLSQQHPARLMRFDTQRSAAQDSYIPASDDSSCGSIVSVSRNPGKHAERLKVIRNHLSASEEPDNRSLSPKELHSALPAQLQHCSAPAHDFKQQVYPALHSAGMQWAIMEGSARHSSCSV